MKTLVHPTHARTSRAVMVALLCLVAVSLAAAFSLADGTGTSLASVLPVVALILFGALCMLVLVARAFVCPCATCGSWLTQQPTPRTDAESRRFICARCDVMWDTGIKLSIGGD